MSNLYIQENWIDRTRDLICGESEVYETFTPNVGELYRSLQKEYGRCTGKVYVDNKDGQGIAVGWVFQQRRKYKDVNETYLAETWVSLHTEPDTVTRTPHYQYLKGE